MAEPDKKVEHCLWVHEAWCWGITHSGFKDLYWRLSCKARG